MKKVKDVPASNMHRLDENLANHLIELGQERLLHSETNITFTGEWASCNVEEMAEIIISLREELDYGGLFDIQMKMMTLLGIANKPCIPASVIVHEFVDEMDPTVFLLGPSYFCLRIRGVLSEKTQLVAWMEDSPLTICKYYDKDLYRETVDGWRIWLRNQILE